MIASDWGRDPKAIREYVAMANADGYRPSSIEQGRGVLLRYSKFVRKKFRKTLGDVGWKEFSAYKIHLLTTGVSRTTIRGYLSYLAGFYLLKAQTTQRPRYLELFSKMQVIGMTRRARTESYKPFSPLTLERILDGARSYSRVRRGSGFYASEDFVFLMTLLYTGGRAQFYGLRVEEIDFKRMEVSTIIKGGRRVVIPLHPKLARILRAHLRTRGYDSEFLFRHGADPERRIGQKSNRQNAWRACKRAQSAAGLTESVHPHRFRKTLGSMGRKFGMDMKFVQAILGHRNPLSTLACYVEPDLEDVKWEFAKVDLSPQESKSELGVDSLLDLVDALRGMAPAGKEIPWNAILDSLLALTGTQLPASTRTRSDVIFLPEMHRIITKGGRTLRVGRKVEFVLPTRRQGARRSGS